ncbi:MAG: hypothetical protein WCX71_03965 [Candidatus Buchananbacteria bacterium]
MIYWDIVLRKKVSFWLALLSLALVTVMAAWALSAKAVSGGKNIGLLITSPAIKCSLDPGTPPPGTCFATCPICGALSNTCASLFEVRAKKLGGTSGFNPLFNSTALCLTNPKLTKGGTFKPGARCLGQVFGIGPHTLNNFGCSK